MKLQSLKVAIVAYTKYTLSLSVGVDSIDINGTLRRVKFSRITVCMSICSKIVFWIMLLTTPIHVDKTLASTA